MDVQTLFFGLGSAFMILGILVLLATLIILLVIWRKVMHVHGLITEKIEELNNSAVKPVVRATAAVNSFLTRKRK